ncbi:hypothetical protein AB0I81_18635 [Nonomuraea sp. NPDC050404]|uniref:hypothetical protein n=1 Tax=Nonomuraea sp. NPDC050404 TaxID=3155783 RepID=UPI0033C6BD59
MRAKGISYDPERVELAAAYAADVGLEVWFSPYPLELTAEEMPAQGKPVAITEFGAAGYQGALGLEIVEYGKDGPVRLTGEYVRDEPGQAAYVRELLEAFDDGGVDSTFVFTFALHDHVHRPDGDPRDDLDLASYGIVKVYEDRLGATYPGMPWDPKAAFTTLADYYRG